MAALALVGCGGAAETDLTGRWVGLGASDLLDEILTLEQGGRYERTFMPAAAFNEAGAWAVEPDGLHLTPDAGEPWPALRWHLRGDELTIVWPPAHTYRK